METTSGLNETILPIMKGGAACCLLCGGDLEPVFEGLWDDRFGTPGRYNITRCRRCSTEQTAPHPSSENLRALYERYYNFGGSIERHTDSKNKTLYVRLRHRFYNSLLYRIWLALDGDIAFHDVPVLKGMRVPRLLDIGCNEGRGLVRYKAGGFEAEGLELNRVAAEAARQLGFTVHTVPISDLQLDYSFDVAVLSNVLEHTLEPRAMLRDIRRVLAEKGEVWISLPNGKSILRSIFGRHWINWHVPYHIVHFTRKSIEKLLCEEGFRIQSVANMTPALWVAQPIITTLFAQPNKPTIKLQSFFLVTTLTLFIRLFLFPFFWITNRIGRGDCLLVRARSLR